MTRILSIALCLSLISVYSQPHELPDANSFCFTENKGQVSDQFGNVRRDILFGGRSGQLSFHLKRDGISYQLKKVLKWEKNVLFEAMGLPAVGEHSVVPAEIQIQRVDIQWNGCNAEAEIVKGNELPGYLNFYLAGCPNGVTDIRSYNEILYRSLYPGIDLHWYGKNEKLKYDYLLQAGADPSLIKLEIKGASGVSVNKAGELVIETQAGKIIEERPFALQDGKPIVCKWKVRGNIAYYETGIYDHSRPLIIDPGVRLWGTYYGGNDSDVGWAVSFESTGNVYHAGYSSSQGGTVIATSGSHQLIHAGGIEDAFLAKFTPGGIRIWATYYGGSVRDVGMYCSIDPNDNIFLSGHTLSPDPGVIATPGSHQASAGGDWDGFLVKFNSAGIRQWGTYYGGPGIEFGSTCAAAKDGSGDVYLCGKTQGALGNVMVTPGAHQTTFGGDEDGYLVKFNSAGVRQWGTYYGDQCTDQGYHVSTDASGYVYFLGNTCSSVGISTPGAYQTVYSGDYDAFITKFNNSGIRQWGTYYGGAGDDRAHGMARDASNGALYIVGRTSSSSSIATDGSYQPNFAGGNWDGFLVKLNSSGSIRDWGTYFGGPAEDLIFSACINNIGYPYIAGYAGTTSTGLSTPGSHQPVHGGGPFDAVLAQFDPVGNRIWSTYYGGSGYEVGQGSNANTTDHVYLCGLADAAPVGVISTAGCHQQTFGSGGVDAFLVKFYDCVAPPAPVNITPLPDRKICNGSAGSLTVSSFGSVTWFTVPSGGSSVGSGSVLALGTPAPGTYSYYAQANTCTNSAVRVGITVTVFPLPNISVISSNTMLCQGSSCFLFASGVNTQTWSTGSTNFSITVSPSVTTNFTLSGTDGNGCSNSVVHTQSVTVCTGLGDQIIEGFTVYPNPAGSELFLTQIPIPSTVMIFNTLGELLYSEKTERSDISVDLSALAEGVYILQLETAGGLYKRKIIKN